MTSCLKATLNPNKQVTYTLASRGHVLVMAKTFRLTSDPSYLTLGPVQKRILRKNRRRSSMLSEYSYVYDLAQDFFEMRPWPFNRIDMGMDVLV